jgi:hypothetical protein
VHTDEVVDRAMEFVRTKAGYPFIRLKKVTFDETRSEWEVLVDVGVLGEDIKKVTINDRDGKIVGFE